MAQLTGTLRIVQGGKEFYRDKVQWPVIRKRKYPCITYTGTLSVHYNRPLYIVSTTSFTTDVLQYKVKKASINYGQWSKFSSIPK